ncbi:MAG: hypothetical protein QW667_06555 [Candidatus Bathyarchaeia archaeon]
MEKNRSEFRSKNARHVILSYRNAVYYVSSVNVQFIEQGNECVAVFHAKNVANGEFEDIKLTITRRLYDVLVDYVKLNDPNLLLLLYVCGNVCSWYLIDERLLKQWLNDRVSYIV